MADEELELDEDVEEEERDWEKAERKPPSIFRRIKWKLEAFWTTVRSIKPFIIRMVQYAPLLWHDRDWDYIFFLEMLRFKIRRMHQHIGRHNILLHTNLYVKQMKYAEFLLDRIIKNDYHADEEKALEEKWGRHQMLTADVPNMSGGHYVNFTRTKCITKEDKEQERADTFALYQKQDATRQKDLDRLFRHIRLYLERWWD